MLPLPDGLYDRMRSQPAPRSDELCAEMGRILEPTWGFVIYGILWVFVGIGLGVVPALAFTVVVRLIAANGFDSPAVLLTLVALMIGGEIASWWLFFRWAARRRRRAAELVRDGVFVDVQPGAPEHHRRRGGAFTLYPLAFAADGVRATSSLEVLGHAGPIDHPVTVLFKNGHRACAVFDGTAMDVRRYAVAG
jgi:hypothetical protein